MTEELSYLRIGRASDLSGTKERMRYRLFEILPGALVWCTFAAMVASSYWVPAVAATFIIMFDLYWFLRTVYFSFHLRSSFKRLRVHMATDWIAKLEQLPITPPTPTLRQAGNYQLPVNSWRDIWHLVIVPVFRESYPVLHDALAALRDDGYPKDRIMVALSVEERGGDSAKANVERALEAFRDTFAELFVTVHPADQAGEIPGKGSNEAWAGREVLKKIIEPKGIQVERVVVSVLDADTVIFPGFFGCLTYHFLTVSHPLRSSFQPVPLFINNVWYAPAFARVMGFSSTFWQLMQQARPERLITFSSHSMSLKALVDIGFWQPNVVSEDSRIFYQCFLHYDGDWRVVPLYFPVAMDANFAGTVWGTLKNQYRQQRRWGYGAENIPYLLYGFSKNKNIPKRQKWEHGFGIVEGFHSWATNSVLIFVLGWLPIVIGQSHGFSQSILSFSLPQITKWIMIAAMIGLVTSAFLSIMLLPPRPPQFGRWKYALMVAQWALLPFTILFLSTLPAIDAQTRLMLGRYMGFWTTPKARK